MSQIKKFIDKVAMVDGRQGREVSMILSDAKLLRDEIMKMMIEIQEKSQSEKIEVVMQGRKW